MVDPEVKVATLEMEATAVTEERVVSFRILALVAKVEMEATAVRAARGAAEVIQEI